MARAATHSLPHAPPESLFAVEKYRESQMELQLVGDLGRKRDDFCIFGDMNDFWAPAVRPMVDYLLKHPATAREVLTPSVMSGKAACKSAWCVRHGKRCCAAMAMVHAAGTPCPAHSSLGLGLQDRDFTIVCTMAWVAQRLLLQEPMILHENVVGHPGLVELARRRLPPVPGALARFGSSAPPRPMPLHRLSSPHAAVASVSLASLACCARALGAQSRGQARTSASSCTHSSAICTTLTYASCAMSLSGGRWSAIGNMCCYATR